MIKIGMIGTGHMGSSIARRIILNNNIKLYLSNRTQDKAINLANELNAIAVSNNEASKCDYVFIGVKPQQAKELFNEIKKELNPNTIIISMMAGLTINTLKSYVSNPIIRIMPNTPVLVGEGMTFYCYSNDVNICNVEEFVDFMKPTGKISYLDESKFDIATVLAGSGPAYIDAFIDYLVKSGIELGLDKVDCIKLVTQMVIGSAKLIEVTNNDPVILKNQVCSPGGSTIEGVKILDDGRMESIIKDCVNASFKKNKELGKN